MRCFVFLCIVFRRVDIGQGAGGVGHVQMVFCIMYVVVQHVRYLHIVIGALEMDPTQPELLLRQLEIPS